MTRAFRGLWDNNVINAKLDTLVSRRTVRCFVFMGMQQKKVDLYVNVLMTTQVAIGQVQAAMNASLDGSFLPALNVPKILLAPVIVPYDAYMPRVNLKTTMTVKVELNRYFLTSGA